MASFVEKHSFGVLRPSRAFFGFLGLPFLSFLYYFTTHMMKSGARVRRSDSSNKLDNITISTSIKGKKERTRIPIALSSFLLFLFILGLHLLLNDDSVDINRPGDIAFGMEATSEASIDNVFQGGKHAIWSRGWRDFVTCKSVPPTYYDLPTTHVISDLEAREYWRDCSGLVWVRIGDVVKFAKLSLGTTRGDLTLITTDGDASRKQGHMGGMPGFVGDDVAWRILKDERVAAWYTQNYDGTLEHWKLLLLPIGFDLHSRREGGVRGLGPMIRARDEVLGPGYSASVEAAASSLVYKCDSNPPPGGCPSLLDAVSDWSSCRLSPIHPPPFPSPPSSNPYAPVSFPGCRVEGVYVNFNWRSHSRHAFKVRREAMVEAGLTRGGTCGNLIVHEDEGTEGDKVWER